MADEGGLRLWAKTDAAFGVPRTVACLLLASPAAHATPRAAALTHLVAKLLEVRSEAVLRSVDDNTTLKSARIYSTKCIMRDALEGAVPREWKLFKSRICYIGCNMLTIWLRPSL